MAQMEGEGGCLTPPSSVCTEAAKVEMQPRLLHQIKSCPKLSPLHVGEQIWHVKAHSMGLLALQLLGPCLSPAGHLDVITLYVPVLF